jgi:hypothetical protein
MVDGVSVRYKPGAVMYSRGDDTYWLYGNCDIIDNGVFTLRYKNVNNIKWNEHEKEIYDALYKMATKARGHTVRVRQRGPDVRRFYYTLTTNIAYMRK